jgi:hypothetical protein
LLKSKWKNDFKPRYAFNELSIIN